MYKVRTGEKVLRELERLAMHRRSEKQQKNIKNIRYKTCRRLKRSLFIFYIRMPIDKNIA